MVIVDGEAAQAGLEQLYTLNGKHDTRICDAEAGELAEAVTVPW